MSYPLITILGPTATGKTRLAVLLANATGAEIISADSRQVYKGMDIGTGKDLSEYTISGNNIPYHLINVAEAGEAYNVHFFVNDFRRVYDDLKNRGKNAILCGGTGMYIEAVLKGYMLHEVTPDELLRRELHRKNNDELADLLKGLKTLHNTTDTTDRERLIRAIEIEIHSKSTALPAFKPCKSIVFGIDFPREIIRERITKRLYQRLENGMIQEVELLIKNGVTEDMLKYYGLEYKFITQYLLGELTYDTMVKLLNTAIHQFAKRQATWFRRMQKNGISMHLVNGLWTADEKQEFMLETLKNTMVAP